MFEILSSGSISEQSSLWTRLDLELSSSDVVLDLDSQSFLLPILPQKDPAVIFFEEVVENTLHLYHVEVPEFARGRIFGRYKLGEVLALVRNENRFDFFE